MKLEIDLIPTTAWGENIRKELGRSKWDKLRKEVLAEQGNKCAVCGLTKKLQCHEVWEFNDETGVQTLKGFQATCSLCHLGSHFGLAQQLAKQGHADLENIVSHFLEVNEISLDQFHEHLAEAVEVFKKRSQQEWEQDFGEWASLLPSK